MENKSPLVSVVIITYNSAKTVLETLDSVYNQTYKNIELIVSDDCSSDDTVSLCQEWLAKHSERFVFSSLVTSNTNTGVAPNLNRGILKSSGVWIKSLAGDDRLKDNCIEAFVSFVEKEKCEFCICRLALFSEDGDVSQEEKNTYDRCYKSIKGNSKEQLKSICIKYTFPGPGFFYSRKIYDSIGGFDEMYPFWEEFPFVYNLLNRGVCAYALDLDLVEYRVSGSSLCRSDGKISKGAALYFNDYRNVFYDIRVRCLLKYLKLFDLMEQFILIERRHACLTNDEVKLFVLKILSLFSFNHWVGRIERFLS